MVRGSLKENTTVELPKTPLVLLEVFYPLHPRKPSPEALSKLPVQKIEKLPLVN